MSAPLTTRIPIRDRDGRVIDEKEVATYAGLLARAHEDGLKLVSTSLVQAPDEKNGWTAICDATVETSRGRFCGIGDANEGNVNRKIAPHIIRMAETRAKARALRDAVNIGIVCMEELSDLADLGFENDGPRTETATRPEPANVRPLRPEGERRSETRPANDGAPTTPRAPVRDGRQTRGQGSDRMTDAQRRLLFRLLSEHGHEAEDATRALCHDAGVEKLEEITKLRASRLIDSYRGEGERRGA